MEHMYYSQKLNSKYFDIIIQSMLNIGIFDKFIKWQDDGSFIIYDINEFITNVLRLYFMNVGLTESSFVFYAKKNGFTVKALFTNMYILSKPNFHKDTDIAKESNTHESFIMAKKLRNKETILKDKDTIKNLTERLLIVETCCDNQRKTIKKMEQTIHNLQCLLFSIQAIENNQ